MNPLADPICLELVIASCTRRLEPLDLYVLREVTERLDNDSVFQLWCSFMEAGGWALRSHAGGLSEEVVMANASSIGRVLGQPLLEAVRTMSDPQARALSRLARARVNGLLAGLPSP